MAEVEKLQDESHEDSDKKKHVVTGPLRGNNRWLQELNRVSGYGVGPHISSRRAVAVVGGMLVAKLGLSQHFNFLDDRHFGALARDRFERSLKKASAVNAVYEDLVSDEGRMAA